MSETLIGQHHSLATMAHLHGRPRECLEECFKAMATDPTLVWEYELAGHAYLRLGMHSQAMGCFAVAAELESTPELKSNLEKYVEYCKEKDRK